MELDAERAIGVRLAEAELAWTPATVALYHLGVGAIAPADVLEDRLVALPTFAALASFPALIHLDAVPGLEGIDLTRVLHGDHLVELAEPVPPEGRVVTTGVVEAVQAKGANALISVRQESRWPDGRLAWTNRYAMFARDVGAFAGSAPPPARPAAAPIPDREPEHVATVSTLPQQAALYRHSGDDNPLHLDPHYARAGGFATPILQGLCSLGMAVRAITDGPLAIDRAAVRAVGVRFTGTVIPGQTLRVAQWRTDDAVAFTAETDAGTPVLGHGTLRLTAP
jgi:acyl dehydratase